MPVRIMQPEDVWSYSTRELTQSKFPFWSAIITQTQSRVTAGAAGTATVEIQPPAGETWWVEIGAYVDIGGSDNYTQYCDYDGTTARPHAYSYTNSTYGYDRPGLVISRILTNSLYARLVGHQTTSTSWHFYYGYSGFKLSQPQWSPRPVGEAPLFPFKRPLPVGAAIPDRFAKLKDRMFLDPEGRIQVILEEDVPLAQDPDTGHVVERYSVYVALEDLVERIDQFLADPEGTGWKKYLDEWAKEGVSL